MASALTVMPPTISAMIRSVSRSVSTVSNNGCFLSCCLVVGKRLTFHQGQQAPSGDRAARSCRAPARRGRGCASAAAGSSRSQSHRPAGTTRIRASTTARDPRRAARDGFASARPPSGGTRARSRDRPPRRGCSWQSRESRAAWRRGALVAERRASHRAGAERQTVDALAHIGQPLFVASEHFNVREQVVRKAHRLRHLHMGETGHDGLDVCIGQADQRRLHLAQQRRKGVYLIAQPQPHVGLRTSDFRFRFRTSDFGLRTSDFGLRTSDFDSRPRTCELGTLN